MSSDIKDPDEPGMGWRDLGDDCPGLDDEAGREEWANILMGEDIDDPQWAKTVLVHDDHGNMVARIRFSDGSEQIYDLIIRRSLEVAKPLAERDQN